MSRIEQLINEIEEYIDSCKFQALSNTKIIVNKEELDALLVELIAAGVEEIVRVPRRKSAGERKRQYGVLFGIEGAAQKFCPETGLHREFFPRLFGRDVVRGQDLG